MARKVIAVASGSLDRLVDGLAIVAGASFLLVCFMIAFDVVGRRYFGVSTRATDEVSGYVLAIGGTLSILYALKRDAHVRVTVLTDRLPAAFRPFIDWLATLAMAAFCAFWVSRVWEVALSSYRITAKAPGLLRTPLVIPQGLWAIAATMVALYALALFLRQTASFARSRGGLRETEDPADTSPVRD